jgi:hypothetical protein
MSKALFLNGVYEQILEEITHSQTANPGLTCYLQPYSTSRIKLLDDSNPTPEDPVNLYISTTAKLNLVEFQAKIVGWQDKRQLGNSSDELRRLEAHLKRFQPSERDGIFFEVNEKPCVNLISIQELKRIPDPFATSSLKKVSNGEPLKLRSRSGGWSVVWELMPSVKVHTPTTH